MQPRTPRFARVAPLAGLAALVTVVSGAFFVSPAASREGAVGASCPHNAQARGFASYRPAVRTYDDPIEDSGNAPDFCAAELVTNDSTTITVGIHAHNRDALEAGDTYGLLLDTDLNPATGGGGTGAEYELVYDAAGARVERWNGTIFDPASAVPVPTEWITGYGPVFLLQRASLGNPTGFNLVFVSSNGTDSDRAPDTRSWAYTVLPFTLKMRALSLGPARAGGSFTARAVVLRSDFDEALTEGKITCAGSLSGRRLGGRGKFARGRVTCTWRVPKGAARKRLSGSVVVTFQGAKASRAFSVRVK